MDEYVELMNNLKLPNPKMMDVAVPANMHIGLAQDAVARKGWAVLCADAMAISSRSLMSCSSTSARSRSASATARIPGALHEPYPKLRDNLEAGGLLQGAGGPTGGSSSSAPMANARPWRSRRRRRGLTSARHIQGGLDAWKAAGGPLREVIGGGEAA